MCITRKHRAVWGRNENARIAESPQIAEDSSSLRARDGVSYLEPTGFNQPRLSKWTPLESQHYRHCSRIHTDEHLLRHMLHTRPGACDGD